MAMVRGLVELTELAPMAMVEELVGFAALAAHGYLGESSVLLLAAPGSALFDRIRGAAQ